MPSVVMNDGTRRNVVITPFVSPTVPANARAASIPTQIGKPCCSSDETTYTIAGASAYTRPTARSISPQIRSITSPAAISAIGAIVSAMFFALSPE